LPNKSWDQLLFRNASYLRKGSAVAARDYIKKPSLKKLLEALSGCPEIIIDSLSDRIKYYCKIDSHFTLYNQMSIDLQALKKEKRKTQNLDIFYVLRFFSKGTRLAITTGDNRINPPTPAICKSRPLATPNNNAVLLKLNEARHYYHQPDKKSFKEKEPIAVWRGACHQPIRKQFIVAAKDRPLINAGDVSSGSVDAIYQREPLSLQQQMSYRYIISIEGNDVATNLKWIMRSNSVCFMPKPKFETWFMEGQLKSGWHYVQIKDDFSDIEEKIQYCESHPAEVQAIINNANRYTEQFYRPRLELMLQVLVLLRYLILSGQITSYSEFCQDDRQALRQLPSLLRKAVHLDTLAD